MTLRPYRPADRAAVRIICIRTGASGQDATGTTVDDELLPDTFALPYVEYAPDLAFVVDDEEGAAGYVIAVADTADFVRWYRTEWMPRLQRRYASLDPSSSTDSLVRMAFDPERMLTPEAREYPAHLHIDLLPSMQGRGLGRAMIERVCTELAARGVPGVHLVAAEENAGALAFYPRVGFAELSRAPGSVTFGRRLP